MTASSNKIRTNVYLDATTKEKAQEIFKQYGLGLSEAFNIFLTQSVLQRGIPFEVKIPNDETLEAIKDAKANKNMTKVSLEDLKKDLEVTNFDITQYLDNKEVITEYLSQILADGDIDELFEAIRNIAKKLV